MLFMFVIGLELNREVVRRTRSTAAGVAVACMAVPFVLGVLLARYLSGHHETGHALGFQLFLGAAMSITAFPVLARILADRGLQHTRVGSIALTSAAAGDAFAWVMLALVVWLSGADAGHPWRLALLVPYAVAMLFVVRPCCCAPSPGARRRRDRRRGSRPPGCRSCWQACWRRRPSPSGWASTSSSVPSSSGHWCRAAPADGCGRRWRPGSRR